MQVMKLEHGIFLVERKRVFLSSKHNNQSITWKILSVTMASKVDRTKGEAIWLFVAVKVVKMNEPRLF